MSQLESSSPFRESLALLEKAKPISGRSSTRSKAPGRLYPVGRGPLYSNDARDCYIYADGNWYTDTVCALGAVSLGYGLPQPTVRVTSLPINREVEALDAVFKIAPWATSVRYVRTGSEATHAAYRIAKRATGRKDVLIGNWAYHGWFDWCERQPDGKPESEHTFLFQHGGEPGATHTGSPTDVAAVFIEPHRWEPVKVSWLRSIREWCTRHGALLVFDEMIYGGRWALGGATEYFGVQPDIACYGKAFGNGSPVAFVAGNDAVAEHGEIVSGTYSGDAECLMNFMSVVHQYVNNDVIDTLWKRGRQLQRGLRAVIDETFTKARVEGAPVHQRIVFDNPDDAPEFAAQMARRYVIWHPACMNVMAAHGADDIERIVEAAFNSLRAMRGNR